MPTDLGIEDSTSWLKRDSGSAVQAAVRLGMPESAVALYARWWQLEAWLRELVYVELRALYGVKWEVVVRAAGQRQTADAAYTHMRSADSGNPLAYLDYSQVVQIIDEHWEQFEYALITRKAWEGRQEELKRIRHRIGHMRRPHPDDLGRLEQTLRDLEIGAFTALASYNDTYVPDPELHKDPVTTGWISGQHEDALRLVRHAKKQYETSIWVRSTRRPWAKWPDDTRHAPGLLWQVEFFLGGRTIDAARLWYDTSLASVRPLLVHLLCHDPHHIGFTFSGADDPVRVADAIGAAFDAVLMTAHPGAFDYDGAGIRTWNRAQEADYRVLTESGWLVVNESTVPISNFAAGGGVNASPGW